MRFICLIRSICWKSGGSDDARKTGSRTIVRKREKDRGRGGVPSRSFSILSQIDFLVAIDDSNRKGFIFITASRRFSLGAIFRLINVDHGMKNGFFHSGLIAWINAYGKIRTWEIFHHISSIQYNRNEKAWFECPWIGENHGRKTKNCNSGYLWRKISALLGLRYKK